MASEKTVVKAIDQYLDSIGAWHVKFHANKFTKVGVPDKLVCYKGMFVGIEVKDPDGEPTPLQLYNIRKIREAGGIAFLADNVQTVKNEMEAHGKSQANNG